MAFDAFLKLEGIKGESQVEGFENQIQIESFHWGVANAGAVRGGGGGGGASVPSRRDFTFTSGSSMASPVLFQMCANGKHLQEGVLTIRSAGESPETVSTVKLTDLIVSEYVQGGSDDGANPLDEFSLRYAKIEFAYNSVKATWDFTTNKA